MFSALVSNAQICLLYGATDCGAIIGKGGCKIKTYTQTTALDVPEMSRDVPDMSRNVQEMYRKSPGYDPGTFPGHSAPQIN